VFNGMHGFSRLEASTSENQDLWFSKTPKFGDKKYKFPKWVTEIDNKWSTSNMYVLNPVSKIIPIGILHVS
jgi:hypothetical protein